MNDINQDIRKNFICYCSGTTQEKIEALIANGIVDFDEISRITGACAGCGGCEAPILDLLAGL